MCFQPPSLLTGRSGYVWCPFVRVPYTAKCIGGWACRGENRVRIDFSAAYDRVNHQGILYQPYSVGIGGYVLSILAQFLSNRSQHVIVDSCSKMVNHVSGVIQGCV